jgi:hypothetical protein
LLAVPGKKGRLLLGVELAGNDWLDLPAQQQLRRAGRA